MRHHHEPQRTKVSLNLGSSGPSPTRLDDADRDYQPPRVLGFTHVVWSKRSTGEVLAVGELGEVLVRDDREPLLWQDDGDQA